MRVRGTSATVAAFAAPMLLAASPPQQHEMITQTRSALSEETFMASVDRYFLMLADHDGDITPAGLRAQFGSTLPPERQPVRLPALSTHFSCVDVNKDGRISRKEYREFAGNAFKSAAVDGVLNLTIGHEWADYESALKCDPPN